MKRAINPITTRLATALSGKVVLPVWLILLVVAWATLVFFYLLAPRPIEYRFAPSSFSALPGEPVSEGAEVEAVEDPYLYANTYTWGTCTWGAANWILVPNNWGNANHWDDSAREAGWGVSNTPQVGAIAQSDTMSYGGHVGLVLQVDGENVRIRDMNYGYRLGLITERWTLASEWDHFIYPK